VRGVPRLRFRFPEIQLIVVWDLTLGMSRSHGILAGENKPKCSKSALHNYDASFFCSGVGLRPCTLGT
jgi:hypothetical protein